LYNYAFILNKRLYYWDLWYFFSLIFFDFLFVIFVSFCYFFWKVFEKVDFMGFSKKMIIVKNGRILSAPTNRQRMGGYYLSVR